MAVKELLHVLGIPQCSVAHTEADDVIAYLAENLPGYKLIYTVDGDLTALINATTSVFLKGEPQTAYYKDGMMILPRHVTLFKSIVGDTSDGIAGIKGMGPAAWVDLLSEFGEDGLDELITIAESDDIGQLRSIAEQAKNKLLDKMVLNLSDWRRSYLLAKLRPELVDGMQKGEFTRLRWDKRLPSAERLDKLMASTQAYWLAQDLRPLMPTQTLITAKDWDDDVLKEATQLFKNSRYISIDWETWAPDHAPFTKAAKGNYVDMLSSKVTGAGFTCGENLEHTFYFQFDHADADNNIDKQHLIELLDCIPEGMPIVAQNCLFERTVFLNEFGFDIPDLHDTKIMASHVDESLSAGLKDMTKYWMNYNQLHYGDVIEKGKTMRDYTGVHVFKYGADDPLVTAHLYDLFHIILNLEGTWEFVRDNEFAMNYILSNSYLAGVSIDFAEVERQHAEDKLTFDNNMAAIRGLLKANSTPESVYSGAKNWMEELLTNHRAEGKYLSTLIAKASNTENFISILRANKTVMSWVKDTVTENATLEEVLDTLNSKLGKHSLIPGDAMDEIKKGEALNGSRAPLWAKAVAAATYADYDPTPTKAKFTWSLGKVNQLSEKVGLPVWPNLTDIEDHVRTLTITTGEQTDLVSAVVSTIEAARRYAEKVVKVKGAPKKVKHTDTDSYAWLSSQYEEKFPGKITKKGSELNLDSPKQACELLYAVLGLPIRTRSLNVTEGRVAKGLQGAPQTDKDAIALAIAVGDATGWKREVLDLLSEAKSASTRIKLFYNKLPMWKHPIDGLIHPQFNSCGTETRRPSGSSPNLLQLSKKGEGLKVRSCFLPNAKLGHDLVFSCDWAAQELRVIAALSGDETMTACYIGDNLLDVHSVTAAQIMGLPYKDFIVGLHSEDKAEAKRFKDARAAAKSTNFGSAYGIGAAKLARQLLCDPEDAKGFLTAKKNAYPGVEAWKDVVKQQLHAQGFVKTLAGSRKHVFGKLQDKDDGMVSYYERASVNFLIQGLCADYLKKVLSDMWNAKTLQRHGAVLIAPIYDELVISCHSSQAVSLVKEVYKVMTQGISGIGIPMLAAPALGLNFANQIEILKDENEILTDELILRAIDKAFGVEVKEAA
jgi:DNA polymerase I-like protein with 3'-5' exonuclease and polymerase domains